MSEPPQKERTFGDEGPNAPRESTPTTAPSTDSWTCGVTGSITITTAPVPHIRQPSDRITVQVSDSDNTLSRYASLPGVSLSLRDPGAYLGHIRANAGLIAFDSEKCSFVGADLAPIAA